MATLYAWANPLSFAPTVDHAWVTDYDITKIDAPKGPPEGHNYWYCWGDYHPTAEHGNILTIPADVEQATRVVKPNTKAPHNPIERRLPQNGSINLYGVEGVCHTVANQILIVTGGQGKEPERVSSVRGYPLSTYFFNNYGLNKKLWKKLRKEYAPQVRPAKDDFEPWLHKQLGEEISAKDMLEVMGIRWLAQHGMKRIRKHAYHMSVKEYEAAIGAVLLSALGSTGHVLGSDKFKKIFPDLLSIPTDTAQAMSWLDRDRVVEGYEAHVANKA